MQLEIDFEIWKDVVGYEGYYLISNMGNIKSKERKVISLYKGIEIVRIFKAKEKKTHLDNGEYLFTPLCKNGKHKMMRIHKMVADAFIPNPKKLKRVKIIDNNKLNCCVSNLSWIEKRPIRYKEKRVLLTPQEKEQRKTEYKKKYFEDNKEEIRKSKALYLFKRRREDDVFRLRHNISGSIRRTLGKNRIISSVNAEKYTGCDMTFLKNYLESLFENWMNWDNYGKYNGDLNFGWDIDHIIPVSLAKTKDDLLKLSHYTNLKPLCSKINRDIKRNLLDYQSNVKRC